MLVVFNLLAALSAALACGVMLGLVALGVPVAVSAVCGCVAAAALDVIVRWRAGRRMMDPRAGGMALLLPVWIWALLGLMAVALIATALPDDWDARRAPVDAGVTR